MRRWCNLVAGVAVVLLSDATLALAQAPPVNAAFKRGPGGYLSLWKILLLWLIFVLWVKTTDWVSQDVQIKNLNYALWNSLTFFVFIGVTLLIWIVPVTAPAWFWIALFLELAAWIGPLAAYIVMRNKVVDPFDRVLTKRHLRAMAAGYLALIGIKIEAETKSADELGPPLQLKPRGAATERDDNVNLLTARQSPGFLPARELLWDALERRADSVMLDYNAQMVMVKYQIDGMWHNHEPQERAKGDLVLAVLKTLGAMNASERRARQSGTVGVEIPGDKKKVFDCKIVSQGTQSGERVLLQLENPKAKLLGVEELGMRPKMHEQLQEMFRQHHGFLLISSMPQGGLTTTIDGVLHSADRFVRNFAAVEDVKKPEHDIENVAVTTYDTSAGETPMSVLPKLVRTYPDVIIVRDLFDAETVSFLCEQTRENRFVIGSVRAKEAMEAPLRVLMMKVPAADFADVLTAVLNVRLVRKLCEKCKEPYTPPSDVLRQLGLPPGKVEAFYRPRSAPAEGEKVEICQECLGVGYKGRTGIFELVTIDDTMRQILTSTPKLELLRDAARKAKQRSLQEEGILLVARGVTSLPELMRVLKQ